ncbi:ATP-binding cassette domain-containing protein [Desulfogranum mediterraneum]|uniref:ATP-binding cassette domain-containing protein n=1 Tax=Desulfogranum mediterraneum TaxID=160661 RepID=UPI00048CCCD2|nr:ATP-binding cassette domain-containing protein [Desulfogranum mediterraneum]
MMTISKLQTPELSVPYFSAAPAESWCLVGSNHSGLDSFCDLLAEQGAGCSFERFELPERMGTITFARQQALFEAELRRDETDFMDRLDPGTLVRSFLNDPERHRELIAACKMGGSLDKGYRQLSSGQARKLCLLAEITRGVDCLVVQNPYEGIDPANCRDLDAIFAELVGRGVTVVITVNNGADIPAWCSHLGVVREGLLQPLGPVEQALPQARALLAEEGTGFSVGVREMEAERQQPGQVVTPLLVRLVKGFAGYGEQQVFSGVNLTIAEGEHTLITGPNGCGKSTLVQLITGDHPHCYTNDLQVFGIQRGSGESIWELKRQMGLVSPDLHRNHTIPGNSLQVVVSGLFDSIGLYQQPSPAQLELARRWLGRVGLSDKARLPFRRLSYAEQRLLLIGRALIKVPRLLILDEPTQGLDQGTRKALLDLLAEIAAEELCTLLYVSHRQDEYRPFFRHQLVLGS